MPKATHIITMGELQREVKRAFVEGRLSAKSHKTLENSWKTYWINRLRQLL